MEKKKKKGVRRVLGLTIGEMCAFATVVASVAGGIHYLDRRFEGIENRLDNIEVELVDLRKTGNLLNQYLTWRFIYVNDPLRKNLVPLYDPATRTIEFVDRSGDKIGK